MTFLNKLLNRKNPNIIMRPLYGEVVSKARQPAWFEKGLVPDTLDGRFDMVTAILCFILIRLEKDEEARQKSAWLTELFVTDMDGQLRQIGIGDMIVGKHIGRMMGALGGRLGAYRSALDGEGDLTAALSRNVYRGEIIDSNAVQFTTRTLMLFWKGLEKLDTHQILAGKISEEVA